MGDRPFVPLALEAFPEVLHKVLLPQSGSGAQSLANRKCSAAFTAPRGQCPTVGHQSSWRYSSPISPTQEAWPQVLSFGKSLCPFWLCSEQDGPGLCVLRFPPQGMRVKPGAGMGSGQGHSRSLLYFQWKTGNLQGGASCLCQT